MKFACRAVARRQAPCGQGALSQSRAGFATSTMWEWTQRPRPHRRRSKARRKSTALRRNKTTSRLPGSSPATGAHASDKGALSQSRAGFATSTMREWTQRPRPHRRKSKARRKSTALRRNKTTSRLPGGSPTTGAHASDKGALSQSRAGFATSTMWEWTQRPRPHRRRSKARSGEARTLRISRLPGGSPATSKRERSAGHASLERMR